MLDTSKRIVSMQKKEEGQYLVGPVHTGGSSGHRFAQFGHHGHKYAYKSHEGMKRAERKARKQELAALYHGWRGNDDALARSFHSHHRGNISERQQEVEIESEVKDPETACTNCSKKQAHSSLGVCDQCRSAYYCDANCQLVDWKTHKTTCFKK